MVLQNLTQVASWIVTLSIKASNLRSEEISQMEKDLKSLKKGPAKY